MTKRRLLSIALMMLAAFGTPAADAHPDSIGGSLLIYNESLRQLTQLDPGTLASVAAPVATLDDRVSAWDIARSADGSTLVTLDPATPGAITVRDGRTGQPHRQFDTGLTIANPVVNADGSRLLVDLPRSARGWALFNLVTGALLSRVTAPEGWVEPVAANQDLTRLYYLTIPTNDPLYVRTAEPHPELVAIELATGAEIGRVALPEVVAGVGPLAEPGGFAHRSTPGLAVSPDGSSIAIVRADRAGFTLVDAASLTVERTEIVTRAQSRLSRLLTWLAILPQSTAAKMATADVVSAAFSPDATRLYVWGYHTIPEPDQGREISRGIGLLALDLATGDVTAQGPDDQLIVRLSTTDGALYITGPTLGAQVYSWIPTANLTDLASTHYLHRLDPDTLIIHASAEYPAPIWLAPPSTTDRRSPIGAVREPHVVIPNIHR